MEKIKQFKNDISKYKNATLDSVILIYFLEKNKNWETLTNIIFNRIKDNQLNISLSKLIFIEILTGLRRIDDDETENYLKYMIEDFINIQTFPIGDEIIEETINIRAKYNISTPDAIHIATAINQKVEIFITNDKSLKKIKEIKIICLKDYA